MIFPVPGLTVGLALLRPVGMLPPVFTRVLLHPLVLGCSETVDPGAVVNGKCPAVVGLTKAGGAVGPLETVPSMMKNPQVVHRNSIRTVEDPVLGPVRMTNIYPRFESWTDTRIQPGRSKVGADTDEVLTSDFGEDWRTQVKNMGKDE